MMYHVFIQKFIHLFSRSSSRSGGPLLFERLKTTKVTRELDFFDAMLVEHFEQINFGYFFFSSFILTKNYRIRSEIKIKRSGLIGIYVPCDSIRISDGHILITISSTFFVFYAKRAGRVSGPASPKLEQCKNSSNYFGFSHKFDIVPAYFLCVSFCFIFCCCSGHPRVY